MNSNDTICALATAMGGAICIIRVSGSDAISITNKVFQGKTKLTDAKPHSLHYGEIIDKSIQQSQNETPIDDVLISVFHAPHSYTGEDSVEISCHASRYIVDNILHVLIENGCRQALPGEYTQRAFLNGKMDLSQAEAVADVIASQNKAQHLIAMNQMRGGISSKLKKLRDKLLTLTSLLELELDFSDHEELEFANRDELKSLAKEIDYEISHLTSSFKQGNAIKNGIPVAIIGAPNVGKSTLLNALLQDDKAIVTDIAGTTRDIIDDTVTIDGILFRFIDTAGIRHTDDTIEQLGIERSIKAAEKAQIIILMSEPGVEYPDISVREGQTLIRICNKTDKFQALNGIGLQELKQQLVTSVASYNSENTIITNVRHYEALSAALNDIRRAEDSLEMNLSGDLIAEDLRLCLDHLSDILGTAITTPEVLNNIFSHFCIGK